MTLKIWIVLAYIVMAFLCGSGRYVWASRKRGGRISSDDSFEVGLFGMFWPLALVGAAIHGWALVLRTIAKNI